MRTGQFCRQSKRFISLHDDEPDWVQLSDECPTTPTYHLAVKQRLGVHCSETSARKPSMLERKKDDGCLALTNNHTDSNRSLCGFFSTFSNCSKTSIL